ncbi:MAG: TRAP transporter large permease subunit [Burkholderiales bacterium]
MSWWITLSCIFGLLLVLLGSGLPIFAGFLLVNVVGAMVLMGPPAIGLFVNSMLDTASSEALVAVPLYMLLGELLFRTGGVEILYNALNRLIGAIRGRMYVVAIALSSCLGAISGSAMASVAMLGRFVYPTMIQRGCDRQLSIGMILAGATLDPIIPPSVLAVILATIAGISIADFLIAGIGPGILLAIAFASYAVVRTALNPALDARPAPDESERGWRPAVHAAVQIIPFLLVIFLVLGLIMLGIAQPTEAAAVGIVGALVLSLVYRTFSLRMVYRACYGAAITTATVLIIIACAKLYSQLLAFTGATGGLIELVSALGVNRWLIFAAMMMSTWIICMFIDELAVMLIAVPVFTPVIAHLGFDPVWFWMMFLINFTLGGITPPIGYTNFVFKSVAPPGTSMGEIMRAAWPIVFIAMGCLVLMCVFPQIVTWLPESGRAGR